jgi:hypothetical protein
LPLEPRQQALGFSFRYGTPEQLAEKREIGSAGILPAV